MGCRVTSASLPRQPAAHPFLHLRSQPGPIVGIATLTNGFGLRWVGMNYRGQSAESEASRDRHTDFADHLSGMSRNDGCSEDFIVPFPDVEFHKTICLTVQNRAVHLLELAHVGVHFQAALVSVAFIETDVSDFRVGVSAPGHRESTCLLAAKEQGILNYDPGGKIGGMGEFPGQAN